MKIMLEQQDKIFIRVLDNPKEFGELYGVEVKPAYEDVNLKMTVKDALNLNLLPIELEDNYYNNDASIFKYLSSDPNYNIIINNDNEKLTYAFWDSDIFKKKFDKNFIDTCTFDNVNDFVNFLEEAADKYNNSNILE